MSRPNEKEQPEYTDNAEIGELEVIADFLPHPQELCFSRSA